MSMRAERRVSCGVRRRGTLQLNSSLNWNFHKVILVATSVGIKWDDLQLGVAVIRLLIFICVLICLLR
jgi:hypothetical protein